LRGSPRRDGAWPTSPILCVSILFFFMIRQKVTIDRCRTFAKQVIFAGVFGGGWLGFKLEKRPALVKWTEIEIRGIGFAVTILEDSKSWALHGPK
jgi:hypothetical protein